MEELEILQSVKSTSVPAQLQEKLQTKILNAESEEKSLRIILPLVIFAIVILGANVLVAKKSTSKQDSLYQSTLNTQLYNE